MVAHSLLCCALPLTSWPCLTHQGPYCKLSSDAAARPEHTAELRSFRNDALSGLRRTCLRGPRQTRRTLLAATMQLDATESGLQLSNRAFRQLERCRGKIAGKPLLIVDGSNLRAAAGFRITPLDLTHMLDHWAGLVGLSSRVILVWDHGSEPMAFQREHAIVLTSGPKSLQTADDVIVQLVTWRVRQATDPSATLIASSDAGLIGRCHAQQRLSLAMASASGHALPAESARLSTMHSVFCRWMLQDDLGAQWRNACESASRFDESTQDRVRHSQLMCDSLEAHRLCARSPQHNRSTRTHETSTTPGSCSESVDAARWFGAGAQGIEIFKRSRTGQKMYWLPEQGAQSMNEI